MELVDYLCHTFNRHVHRTFKPTRYEQDVSCSISKMVEMPHHPVDSGFSGQSGKRLWATPNPDRRPTFDANGRSRWLNEIRRRCVPTALERLGTGSISSQWVMCLNACKGATVTAVAARSGDRAQEFAAKFGTTSAYGSYGEMVASPEVDIVSVGTITRLHLEHSLLAIAAGKHVLCEKPLAETATDARVMYDAATEKNVMLRDGMWSRFFPAWSMPGRRSRQAT